MKSYFAKYLPVEGELLASKPPKVKKKLFLCSRDVKVGGYIYGLREGGWDTEHRGIAIEQDRSYFFIEENGDKIRLRACFKVVGEISSKALWVKEGDEFDEEEIKKKGKLAVNHYVDWIEGREKLGYECMVFIQCPTCKKFH